jgi:hypothetical protein
VIGEEIGEVVAARSAQHIRWKEPTVPTDPYRPLARHCDRIGRHRPDLIAAVDLPDVTTVAELFAVIRDTRAPETSDRALRRLAREGRLDPDVVTLIVGALAPQLRMWTAKGRSPEFHDDLLGELTLAVYDAIERGDFETCGQLAARVRWRTHVRVSKHNRKTRVHGETNLTTTDPCSPEVLAVLCAEHGETPAADPVGEAAMARVDLARFGVACREAVEAGSLPAKVWDSYRQHRLARALVEPMGPTPNAERKRAERAAARMQWFVDDLLGGHAA